MPHVSTWGGFTIRFEALTGLMSRGKVFSEDECKKILIQTKSPHGAGFFGASINDPKDEEFFEKIIVGRLKRTKKKELLKQVEEGLIYDDAPYFALVEKYFNEYGDDLRKHIDDNFKKFFSDRLERLKSKMIGINDTDVLKKTENLGDFLRKQFARKGLDILCEKCKLEDLERIRDNVKSEYAEISILEIKYFLKHGEWSDIKLLANCKNRSSGRTILTSFGNNDFEDGVAEIAYKLGKRDISRLLGLELSANIVKKILTICSNAIFSGISEEVLFELFNNKEENVRKFAAMNCVLVFSEKRIKAVLDKYISGDNYRYYNVIHWLDLGVSMTRSEARKVVKIVLNKEKLLD